MKFKIIYPNSWGKNEISIIWYALLTRIQSILQTLLVLIYISFILGYLLDICPRRGVGRSKDMQKCRSHGI
jgi:hypothetical protein